MNESERKRLRELTRFYGAPMGLDMRPLSVAYFLALLDALDAAEAKLAEAYAHDEAMCRQSNYNFSRAFAAEKTLERVRALPKRWREHTYEAAQRGPDTCADELDAALKG